MHPALTKLTAISNRAKERVDIMSPINGKAVLVPTSDALEAATTIGLDAAPALIAALVEIERCANGGTYAVTATIVNEIINRHLEPLK